MTATLLALVLLLPEAPPAPAQESCGRLYARARKARDASRYAALARLARRARECYDRRGSAAPGRARLMRLYSWEGFGLRKTQRGERALACYNAFFKHFAAHPDSLWFSFMYRQRGFVYYGRGNLSGAARDYERTLAYAASASPRKRADLSVDLGLVFQRMRAFRSARRYYRRADTLLRSLDQDGAETRAVRVEVSLARADLFMEAPALGGAREASRHRRAIRLARTARSMLKRLPRTPAHQESMLRALTLLAEARGPLIDTRTAESYLDRAARKARRLGSGHWAFLVQYKRARLYEEAGRLDRAETAYRRALARSSAARNDDYRRRLLVDLGELYEKQRAPARAEQFFRRAIGVTEAYRASLRATDWSTAAFDEWKAPYRGLVRVLLGQGRPEAAFRLLEKTRARHLRDLRTRARLAHALPAERRARFDSLTARLSAARRQLQHASSPSGRQQSRQHAVRLAAARRALLDLPPPRDTLALPALQAALASRGRALLSYFLDTPPPERPARSYVFVVTADTLRAVPLSTTAEQVRRRMAAASPLLSETGNAAPVSLNAMQFDLRPLRRLYDALFAPVRALTEEDHPLTIVPDGPLYRLPFGLLARHAPARFAYRQADFLLRHHPLSTELSTLLLAPDAEAGRARKRRAPGSLDFLAFGKARFEDVPRPAPADSLPPLPGVARETHAAAALFQNRRVFLNGDATETAFYETAPRATILHLASHAVGHPRSPLSSVLVLSPGGARADSNASGNEASAPRVARHAQDGLLHLSELEDHRLPVPLVTLSACRTARGQTHAGEGMQSLQYAFRAMGAASTLSNLWRAEDETAATLTRTFYHALIAGRPRDVALQKAQLALLDGTDEGRASPFFWAGVQLYGHAAPLTLEGRRLPFWRRPQNVALGLVCLLALCAGALLYRHLDPSASSAPE